MDSTILSQIALAGAVSTTVLAGGMNVGFPAVALPAMMMNSSSLLITSEEASWIASLPQLTMIVGCLIVGPVLENYGRKVGLLLASFSSLAGWLCVGTLKNIWAIYLGRLLMGLGMGIGTSAVSVVLTEMSSPRGRGALTMARNISFSVGLTLIYVLGLCFRRDWEMMALLGSLFPASSCLLVCCLVPESRVWLESRSNLGTNWSHLWNAKARPELFKPLTIMNIQFFFRQMSGTSVVLTYAVSVAGAAGVKGDPYLVAVGLGVSRIVGGLGAAWVSNHWGRRAPVTYTGTIMSLSMLWLARYNKMNPDMESIFAAPLLIVFVLSSTVFSAIPQAMLSEVFPTDVRGMATAFSSCTIFWSSFLSLKMYPGLLSELGKDGTFMFYAGICIISTLWAILFLPETQNKTFEEIGIMFNPSLKKPESEVMIPMKDITELELGHPDKTKNLSTIS